MSGREELVEYLRGKLIGPGLGEPDPKHGFERETITGRLSLAYMMGMLYPRLAGAASGPPLLDDAAEAGGPAEDEDDEPEEDPLSLAGALRPASMGISVCVAPGTSLSLEIKAAVYEAGKERKGDRRWVRRPLEQMPIAVNGAQSRTAVLEARALLEIIERELRDGSRLLTVSLANAEEVEGRQSIEGALFQVEIALTRISGDILPYPSSEFVPPTDEERELLIHYGQLRPFAVGHGVATDWDLSESECVAVTTAALPRAHVWRPLFDRLEVQGESGTRKFDDDDLFRLHLLGSGDEDRNSICDRLGQLVDFYEEWIDGQAQISVDHTLIHDAKRIRGRCVQSANRMRDGITMLRTNATAYRAFTLANRVMLMAMSHASRAAGRGRQDDLQGPFELGLAETMPIDYFSNTHAQWRPFQLAFMLQVLPALVRPDLPDRSIVDVIWFATGGGKTEAYLFAAAFELIRRRLAGKHGSGVAVINRYTFRFLTADQFQRTAGMICALEMLRSQLADSGDRSLGEEEFSIGLFVGADTSPNKFVSAYDDRGADQLCNELLDSRAPRSENPFPIESCPSCGTLLVPQARQEHEDGSTDLIFYGFSSSATNFTTRCPDEDCHFHGRLPIYFIDEQIYRSPPSFLLGTVDKFAMVPWSEQAGRLFGCGTVNDPPSLIIQDELHLISGPLGTLAGIYEAGFETLMTAQGSPPPKVIASSATIRNAATQCRRIYGRDSAIFPSPGIRSEDSFFSRLDVGNVDRSRLYVGVMGQGIRSTIAVSWAVASILQGVHELDLRDQLTGSELDAYWTLVAYHNSKRELGRIANATRDEIPTRMKVYAGSQSVERPGPLRVLELKSHSEIPIPQARQQLAKNHSPEAPAVDVAPCTSIISVGVDIDRLGLMLVNGQPKLTAEYIQATSRVGRGNVPGLVVSCYSPTKPRDRSHYEGFRDYHEKFYSFVEPTSVTPGAIPAIDRALHAAIVTVIRHGRPLRQTFAAAQFDAAEQRNAELLDALSTRLQRAYVHPEQEEERARIRNRLAERVQEWATWVQTAQPSGRLAYRLPPRQAVPSLLLRFGDRPIQGIGWSTLQSMRHVDREIVMEG